jgi:hypothetical protein
MSVIQKLIRAVESRDLHAFYVVQLKHKPVRLQETILWSTQGMRIFSTGYMRFELKTRAPENYRIVFRELEFDKWLHPNTPDIGKRVALSDALASDLIALLFEAANKHDVRLAWRPTKQIIQKHLRGLSAEIIKRKVFDKLPSSAKQGRQRPSIKDMDRESVEAAIAASLRHLTSVRPPIA